MSFRPFLVAQGIIVLFAFFVIAAAFVSPHKLNQSAIIKTAITKQTSAIVAGKPVTWSILVKRSDITSKSYLAKLPKSARNIKITTISKKTAAALAAAPTPTTIVTLTLK